MGVRGVAGPLFSATTYRRAVHLLLGGVLLLPYLLLGWAFARMYAVPGAPQVLLAVVLAVTALVGLVPPFLRGTRALEIAAARSLLGVALPDPPATAERGRAARETRLRAALWFAVHLCAGGVVALLLFVPVAMGLAFTLQWLDLAGGALAGLRLGPLDEHDTGWLALLGAVLLVGALYAVAGLGGLAAVMAPVLLGPSPAERIAALEARAARLAERNRLARELHDSIGHALTVTTLQAAAAREVLEKDPAFAARALAAIEETGRAAAEDLDRVLGMLREPDDAHGPPEPHGRLADLDRLVAHARGAGVEVGARVEGPVDGLPAAVSREGYRIVQESLTNALRHAGRVPVALRVRADARTLAIEVTNPVTGVPGRRQGGHGLSGMRERVAMLGGSMTAGVRDGQWRVSVRLPVGEP
ncbi:two-component sensor histidine kinase [Sphaerisporangium krabiense]|uniref:histidine kinase n=1 Tax=Sphaerisporangium krabiense TaxID=763782 RepID=A0A7W8ZB24_9ACTN|nr:histidine kinase [Sphaerisporangium krabiense]MBB5630734.1 signal transduction histidine kinase [Sphaerisporangium krabiense]GII65585.1 two-component sensor histidine kinase [Sphaerisporangium krabiense]